MLASILFCTAASAFESEPQTVYIQDEADVFSVAEFSSGYLPSGSPIAVEFRVEANGGAAVSMKGDSNVSWPSALELAFEPEAGTGIYVLEASIDAVTSIIVDLSDWGYYGEFEIDRQTVLMDGTSFFDPFALDARVEVADTLATFPIVTYSFEVFPTVSVNFDAELAPVVTTGFEGVHWSADGYTINAEGATVQLPPERVGNYLVDAVYRAAWDARLDLVVSPTISLSAPFIGDIDIIDLDIPIEIIGDVFEQDFPSISLGFPLPLLEPGLEQANFGDVVVGSISNIQVPLANAGELEAYGTAAVQGDTVFSVYPTTFNALPGTEDGLVVTFNPPQAGTFAGNLVLTSNDPTYPDLVIPLTGDGVTVDDGGDDTGTDGIGDADSDEKKVETCGCAAVEGAPNAFVLALFALGAVVGLRRSRA